MSRQHLSQNPDAETLHLCSRGPDHTAHLAVALADVLKPGDCVALTGDLGAGKSHFARALVRHRLADAAAQVPSPSYTLVNVYAHPLGDIWHADLYRLGSADEMDELGLEDALADAIVVVEWAERWYPPPARRLGISLMATGPDTRAITVAPVGPGWHGASAAMVNAT